MHPMFKELFIARYRDLCSRGIADCQVTAITITRCDGLDSTHARYPLRSAHRQMGRLVMWCRRMSGCSGLRHDRCGLQPIHPVFGAHRVGRTAARAAG